MGKTLISALFAFLIVLSVAQHPNMSGGMGGMDPRSRQRSAPSSLLELLEDRAATIFGAEHFYQMKEDALKVYDLWTGNTEDRNRKARTEHAANRPGEGMPDEAFIRQKKMEARQRLEDIEASGEYPKDIRTQKAMFEYWKEKTQSKRTKKQDERFDFIEEDSVSLHADMAMNLQQEGTREGGRQLSTINDQGELVIYKLEEPYPTECYNHGQMAKQTQKYYMCRNDAQSQPAQKQKEAFRVSKETYDFLTANHTDQYTCHTKDVENNVCVCPEGKSDFECLTASYQKCYLNITDPMFY